MLYEILKRYDYSIILLDIQFVKTLFEYKDLK